MHLRLQRALFALSLSFTLITQAVAIDNRPLLGFTREGSERERELEARFDSLLKKDDLREWMKRLSARPHHILERRRRGYVRERGRRVDGPAFFALLFRAR